MSGVGPGGYLVKDFADGWYWTPNAALDHAGGATVWSVADSRYETDPPASALLTAAPAPEGGAVKGLGDYTMSLTEPQAFERFPALASHIERMVVGRSVGSLIEWDAFLRELNAALATREVAPAPCKSCNGSGMDAGSRFNRCPDCSEEAPAEAGEVEWTVDYNAVVAVSAHLQKQGLLDSAKAVERMLSRAAAYRNCRDTHAELDALRAQPQAREDAQPVEVTIFCPKCALPHVDEGEWATTRHHKTHQCQGCSHEWRPFPFATVGVVHPAPDALRVAVEALRPLVVAMEDFLNEPQRRPVSEPIEVRDYRHDAYRVWTPLCQALSALQAEQKGGA